MHCCGPWGCATRRRRQICWRCWLTWRRRPEASRSTQTSGGLHYGCWPLYAMKEMQHRCGAVYQNLTAHRTLIFYSQRGPGGAVAAGDTVQRG